VNTSLEQQTKHLPNGEKLFANGWRATGFWISRDSQPLDESNFYTALARLANVREFEPADVGFVGTGEHGLDAGGCPVAVAHFGHWALGWTRELLVHVADAATCDVAEALVKYLETEYPVLDETDYCERQFFADHPSESECLSDDGECSCGIAKGENDDA